MQEKKGVKETGTAAAELARWQKKVSDQACEIRQLKSERGRAQAGLAEWGKVVDSTLAQIAVTHGAQVGEGAWEIVVPRISVKETARDYTVKTAPRPDDQSYIVRVERRAKKDNEGKCSDTTRIHNTQ